MFDQQNNVPSGSLRDCQDVPHRIVGSEMQQNFNRKFSIAVTGFLYGKQQKLSQPPRVEEDEEEKRLRRITSSLRTDNYEKGLLCRYNFIHPLIQCSHYNLCPPSL